MNHRKLDFTIGIVLGTILTFMGTLYQFYLQKSFYERNEHKETAIIICNRLDNRINRSSFIISSSGSSVFLDRWDDYISEVINPWNSNLYLMDFFIKNKHPEVYANFEEVCLKFRELHKLLNEVRKKQGAISNEAKNELNRLETESTKLASQILELNNSLKTKLLE